MSKGSFVREDAVTMLTAHEGNVDAAFQVYKINQSCARNHYVRNNNENRLFHAAAILYTVQCTLYSVQYSVQCTIWFFFVN